MDRRHISIIIWLVDYRHISMIVQLTIGAAVQSLSIWGSSSVPNNPIESPIPSRLPWQHNRIQLIRSDSIRIANCNLPIATLTGVEDRGGGAASLC